jgi:MFS family permease
MAMVSFLDRERSIAGPGYSRWLVPPAALAIHLSIGQAYAFSVFKIPMTTLLGITAPAAGDWQQGTVAHLFQVAIAFLGVSAAVFGAWLERVGPRKAMFVSAVCFSGGFVVSAGGVWLHQFWLVLLGYGVLGGVGLGLGYISPVSTLIKWFPDRPGMATGLAIMGFGGGALIAAPLSVALMAHFKSATSMGVAEAFVSLGVIYFIFMMFGVFSVRLPATGWAPRGFVPRSGANQMITTASVEVGEAVRTPQFWLLWVMLCLNVTAGIGILEQASPMIQEMFAGAVTAAVAGGFVGLLSLANMGGRFAWSSLSDRIGRKATYATFFLLGPLLYAAIPHAERIHSVVLFVLCCAVILSMYGGGFATIPAYLRDMFGNMQVGAIHGRLLTAWSTAGILGPLLVNGMRQYEIDHGVAKADAYTVTMYLMAGLLLIAFVCNLFVRPVDPRHHYASKASDAGGTGVGPSPTGPSAAPGARTRPGAPAVAGGSGDTGDPGMALRIVVAWTIVGIPLAWGVWQVFLKALALFK